MAMAAIPSHTASSNAGEPSDFAIAAGVRKMPSAMDSPQTTAIAAANPSSRFSAIREPILVHELQPELNQAWSLRCQDVIERRRTDVAVRQPEVRMIQDVKELGAELKLSMLCERDV